MVGLFALKMEKNLLIITGSSRGIGESILSKSRDSYKDVISISSSNNSDLKLDLTDYNETYNKISSLINNYPLISNLGIVLCAAQVGEYGGLFNTNLDEWDKLYRLNVLGNLAVIKGCEQLIKAGIKLRVVFFSGGGAAFGYPEFFGYSLSKVSVVRAVENLSIELDKLGFDQSIIALAPGAVQTKMLDKVISHCEVRTKTDISEPTNFVYNFLTDKIPSKELNGRFLHVRDDINAIDFLNKDLFKLRRIK
jgi:NAD(P)-dependent dehydrogenase (short-subunit alcohol dehydrogenase family)